MPNDKRYEVEMKFPLQPAPAPIERLRELGFSPSEPHLESDHYFSHPSRDFRETDEAFRVRESRGGVELTYKGPKLDRQTKTREELEIPLLVEPHTATSACRMFEALGFRRAATVVKTRKRGGVEFQGRNVTVVWDQLEGVGEFLELEIVVDEAQLDAARQTLLALAEYLQLGASTRASYLELVLARTNSGSHGSPT